MSAITYESLSGALNTFRSLGLVARSLDSVETFMVIQRASVLNLPAASLYQAWARQDAQLSWSREQAAVSRIDSCHQWFSQSRQSIDQLGRGVDTWARANEMSRQTADAMRQVIGQPRQWQGAGADGQKQKAMEQLHAQDELTEVTSNLKNGCEATRLVMTNVFLDLALNIHLKSLGAMASATRAPSAFTGFFALNSRVKAVAAAMEQAATQYEAVRSGRGWSQQSSQLANTFSENGARLAVVAAALKMSLRPLLV